MGDYAAAYRKSLNEPEAFWAEAAADMHWFRTWDRVLDATGAPFSKWFVGGECNVCYNAVDRHVDAGRGNQLALVYDSPVTSTKRQLTFAELQLEVAKIAGALIGQGVATGDRILIYMPNMPESVMAMLACARIGAIHSVVFGGFAAKELATRIDDAKPKLILAASCGIEPGRVVAYKPLLDQAMAIAKHKPAKVIVLQRPQQPAELQPGRDLDWQDTIAAAPAVDCVPLEANAPLYILYTSGTTGVPKGVVHDHGGSMVALNWSMKNIYGVAPGDVYWAASDIGWVVGHSYMVYAPLLRGCTTVIYEGKPVGTPDATAFWRVMAENKVNVFFTAPTAFRAIKREDPQGQLPAQFDLKALRTLFLAGERADPDTIHWAERALNIPVVDHWWQTETSWPIAANPMGLEPMPVKYGSAGKAVPGYDVRILDEGGHEVGPNVTGAVTVKLPLPPGTLPTLWQNDDGFVATYLSTFPGYYETKDAGYCDDDGYLYIMARTDDIINVAGHRLSTGGIEEILAAHPDVAECAVIGVKDSLKGQVPVGLAVLNAGVQRSEADIAAELVQRVRDQLGPVAAFKSAIVVKRLPKTRSGKVLRGTMRKIADGEAWQMPATIDDPTILDEIGERLAPGSAANR